MIVMIVVKVRTVLRMILVVLVSKSTHNGNNSNSTFCMLNLQVGLLVGRMYEALNHICSALVYSKHWYCAPPRNSFRIGAILRAISNIYIYIIVYTVVI